jgi:mono/diheme cytochrome c family protein
VRRKGRVAAVFAIAGGAALVALALAGARGFLFEGTRAVDLQRGAAIYAEACAACHGAELEGPPAWTTPGSTGRLPAPPHDETGHTWHHPDSVLLEIMRVGTAEVVGGGYESDMPGFGEAYSDDELRDVLDWIKAQWPERERAFQSRVTARDAGGG